MSERLEPICAELIRALEAIERFQRRLFPPAISPLLENLLPISSSFTEARKRLDRIESCPGAESIRNAVDRSADLVGQALELITASGGCDMETAVLQVMRAFRKCCRAQEQLYPLRRAVPFINPFFLEPPVRNRVHELDPDPPPRRDTGLRHIGTGSDPYARGSSSLYVPESYDGSESWPLVVALHGGFGHGRDFLWTWLREARSRRFLLLAPSSIGSTWSLLHPEVDGAALVSTLGDVKEKWNVDPDRVLLTGISDGGTFALISSTQRQSPFTAFAVISGALPPIDFSRTRGRRVYWVHGALDWMFPVEIAQKAAKLLEKGGAEMSFRVVKDLSHTYPRDENDGILTWFDPRLGLSNG